MISIPENVKRTDLGNSITWYNGSGILYSINKKGATSTLEEAISMVSDSAFTLKAQPYPPKMFNSEKEAKKWLKTFL